MVKFMRFLQHPVYFPQCGDGNSEAGQGYTLPVDGLLKIQLTASHQWDSLHMLPVACIGGASS